MSHFYTDVDHFALLPVILLALFGCAVFLFDFLLGERSRRWQLALVLPGLALTGWQLTRQGEIAPFTAFHGALTIDAFGLFFNWLFLVTAGLVALLSYRYLEVEQEHQGEYYGLVLMAQAGAYFLAVGTELITIFVGLETMSISFYVLAGFLRRSRRSNEAALKYLLLGAFSSGLLAYGFSLLYGLAGSTYFGDIAAAVAARPAFDPLTVLAILTVSAGILFKIAAAPFHMWAPDVYEGAPTAVTAYLAVGSKLGSLALLLRLFLGPLGAAREAWEPLLIVAAVVSLTVGNLAALTQSNVKRLLAYSSIAHAGYLLLGVVAGNATGWRGVAVYAAAYALMTLGAFAVLLAVHGEEMTDLNGLARRHPATAAVMVLFLVSLAGLPPTAGFVGKYYIFLALIEAGRYGLAVVGAVYVAVALFYYFRVVRSMFLTPGAAAAGPVAGLSAGVRVALGVTGVLTLGAGVYPEPLLQWAVRAVLK
ncbi:MAG: NADH-quinone oxidoreductase subunit N [Acidobacteriaceae bacterium]|nr:NADH-quinone oxidoreductase subunit N [Acidobacteriaceae bacterium]